MIPQTHVSEERLSREDAHGELSVHTIPEQLPSLSSGEQVEALVQEQVQQEASAVVSVVIPIEEQVLEESGSQKTKSEEKIEILVQEKVGQEAAVESVIIPVQTTVDGLESKEQKSLEGKAETEEPASYSPAPETPATLTTPTVMSPAELGELGMLLKGAGHVVVGTALTVFASIAFDTGLMLVDISVGGGTAAYGATVFAVGVTLGVMHFVYGCLASMWRSEADKARAYTEQIWGADIRKAGCESMRVGFFEPQRSLEWDCLPSRKYSGTLAGAASLAMFLAIDIFISMFTAIIFACSQKTDTPFCDNIASIVEHSYSPMFKLFLVTRDELAAEQTNKSFFETIFGPGEFATQTGLTEADYFKDRLKGMSNEVQKIESDNTMTHREREAALDQVRDDLENVEKGMQETGVSYR